MATIFILAGIGIPLLDEIVGRAPVSNQTFTAFMFRSALSYKTSWPLNRNMCASENMYDDRGIE
jgi:hypothetical protein